MLLSLGFRYISQNTAADKEITRSNRGKRVLRELQYLIYADTGFVIQIVLCISGRSLACISTPGRGMGLLRRV